MHKFSGFVLEKNINHACLFFLHIGRQKSRKENGNNLINFPLKLL